MKYLNIIIVCIVGVFFALTSCNSELPYPDSERVTILTIENLNDFPFLTSLSDPNTDVRIATRLHKYGGIEYSKVEICVVRNPNTNNYQTAVLAEITSGLDLETPIISTVKLSEIISKTGGGTIDGGDQFGFYYNVIMPDGATLTGWTKPTGFTVRGSINNLSAHRPPGQVHNFLINVVCGLSFSDLLGEWTVNSPTFFAQVWDAVVTEDPDKPGAGLIFTMLDNEEFPTPNPVKIGIDMATYKFTFDRQLFLPGPLPGWNATYLQYTIDAAAGDISSCDIRISFSTIHRITGPVAGSFGAFPIEFRKK